MFINKKKKTSVRRGAPKRVCMDYAGRSKSHQGTKEGKKVKKVRRQGLVASGYIEGWSKTQRRSCLKPVKKAGRRLQKGGGRIVQKCRARFRHLVDSGESWL